MPHFTVTEAIFMGQEQEGAFGLRRRQKRANGPPERSQNSTSGPTDPDAIVRFLSGGNQQKVVLARWLARNADMFILDEPTVGVDIGARSEIYTVISRLARTGAGVLVSSSDPAELIGLCDRILVMLRGQIVAEFDPANCKAWMT